MATSFKRRGASTGPQHPRGSRPSLHNAQLLVSTGVPSMDVLLGGGLAVGTVLLIEEDVFASYSRVLLKMFLAEGVMCGHSLYLASASEDPTELLKDLPSAVGEMDSGKSGTVPDSQHPVPGQAEVDQMKIAWRYQNLPKVQSSFSNRFGHFFDLTSSMDPSRLASVDTTTFDVSKQLATRQQLSECRGSSELYSQLKTQIQSKIDTGGFSVDLRHPPQQRNVLRIALHSLGSPLWLDEGSHDSHPHQSPTLTQFLHTLRGLLRRAYAVALVTIPTHLMQDDVYVRRLERLCDAAVKIVSFTGQEPNPLYQDYHGLFQLVKLPCLNSLTPHLPETLDLVFKLKRKSFSIEKRHLPPEFSDTASRAQEDFDTQSRGQSPRVGVVLEGQGSKVAGKRPAKLSKHNIDF